jgi:hypothetical protein
MRVMENQKPQRTPDQTKALFEHLDLTTLNKTIGEELWEWMLGGPEQVAAAGPLSAQPLEAREEFFDLISFMIRRIGPVAGDLGHRLATQGKPNPFVSDQVPAVPAEEALDESDFVPVATEDDTAAMRAELDRFASVSDADIWAGLGIQS